MSKKEGNSDTRESDQDHEFRSEGMQFLYRIKRSTAWMAFFTMVIAIEAASGAYIYWQQLVVMQDQLEQIQELSEQFHRTISASQVQAAAAEKTTQNISELIRQNIDSINRQIDAAGKAAEITRPPTPDRPSVSIETVSADTLKPSQNLVLKASIRNTGNSPALNLRAFFRTAVPAASNAHVPAVAGCDSCQQALLLPNGALSYEVKVDGNILTSERVGRIRDGIDEVILLGFIDYADIAGQKYTTKVCLRYMPKTSDFNACAKSNQLD